jgi:murein L,D-transpeptidase YafK
MSKYWLSLGIDYPIVSDKILGDKKSPGGDIFIHGGSSSVGCIAIGDENIKELYITAQGATERGQRKIPVHIFPAVLSDANIYKLKKDYEAREELILFWENIKIGFDMFEKDHMIPEISVDGNGMYICKQR